MKSHTAFHHTVGKYFVVHHNIKAPFPSGSSRTVSGMYVRKHLEQSMQFFGVHYKKTSKYV